MSSYIDTSALAKWYLPEHGSEEFEAWLLRARDAWCSSLVGLELRSLLARRLRMGELTGVESSAILSAFEADIGSGALVLRPVTDEILVSAHGIFPRCHHVALRTLDAIHLAAALAGGAGELVTSDQVMEQAAKELDMGVRFFGRRRRKGKARR